MRHPSPHTTPHHSLCLLWVLSPDWDILTDKTWALLYIFSIFCPDLLIVEMGMRSEDVQSRAGQQPGVSGQSQPHTSTLYYRVLTLLRLGLGVFIFIICTETAWQTGDSNHSRADALHQTAGLLAGHTNQDTFTAWKILAGHGGFQHSWHCLLQLILCLQSDRGPPRQ